MMQVLDNDFKNAKDKHGELISEHYLHETISMEDYDFADIISKR